MSHIVALSLLIPALMSPQSLRPGEQRLNSPIYKSSHNSYDRDESLATQIDAFNVWQIELDIYDYQGEMKVNHNCDPGSISAASTLEGLLRKMVRESVTYRDRFTIIYLDLKGNGHDACPYSWGASLPQRLTGAFQAILGTQTIYPSSQFIQADQSQWPSHQELVRRGFHWSVIVDWHGPTPANPNPGNMFFTVALNDPPSNEAAEAVLVNVDGGCNDAPASQSPSVVDARWLYRVYPGGCGQGCLFLGGNYWQTAVVRRFNLIATNCIDDDSTFAPPLQSPDPLYVSARSSVNCPRSYATCEWGTITYPFQDASKAIGRASPMTTVLLPPGQYSVAKPAPFKIDHAVILKVNGAGAVVLR